MEAKVSKAVEKAVSKAVEKADKALLKFGEAATLYRDSLIGVSGTSPDKKQHKAFARAVKGFVKAAQNVHARLEALEERLG